MKTYTIYDALEFIVDRGYSLLDIIAIGYSTDILKNTHEFSALSKRGQELTINLIDNTIKIKPYNHESV